MFLGNSLEFEIKFCEFRQFSAHIYNDGPTDESAEMKMLISPIISVIHTGIVCLSWWAVHSLVTELDLY